MPKKEASLKHNFLLIETLLIFIFENLYNAARHGLFPLTVILNVAACDKFAKFFELCFVL
jgi:hypothetical protein